MEQIKTAIDNILEKNLDAMRQNIQNALSEKAASVLEEKKKEVATDLLGTN